MARVYSTTTYPAGTAWIPSDWDTLAEPCPCELLRQKMQEFMDALPNNSDGKRLRIEWDPRQSTTLGSGTHVSFMITSDELVDGSFLDQPRDMYWRLFERDGDSSSGSVNQYRRFNWDPSTSANNGQGDYSSFGSSLGSWETLKTQFDVVWHFLYDADAAHPFFFYWAEYPAYTENSTYTDIFGLFYQDFPAITNKEIYVDAEICPWVPVYSRGGDSIMGGYLMKYMGDSERTKFEYRPWNYPLFLGTLPDQINSWSPPGLWVERLSIAGQILDPEVFMVSHQSTGDYGDSITFDGKTYTKVAYCLWVRLEAS